MRLKVLASGLLAVSVIEAGAAQSTNGVCLDVMIGFSGSSPSTYAGGYYTFRAGSDPTNTLRPVALLKGGAGPYVRFDDIGRDHWGNTVGNRFHRLILR